MGGAALRALMDMAHYLTRAHACTYANAHALALTALRHVLACICVRQGAASVLVVFVYHKLEKS